MNVTWYRNLFWILLLVMVAKWGGMIYTDYMQGHILSESVVHRKEEGRESKEYRLDFSKLTPRIEKEWKAMHDDIDRFITHQATEIRERMYEELDREDGYLDWLYGWGNGYKILWHWAGGKVGITSDARKYIAENFRDRVVLAAHPERTSHAIEVYIRQRVEDYYRSVLGLVGRELEYARRQLGDHAVKVTIDSEDLPWGKYIAQLAIDAGGTDMAVSGAAALYASMAAKTSGGLMIKGAAAKAGAAKAAASAGSKGISHMVGEQLGTFLGSKVATGFATKVVGAVVTLGVAVIVDYLFNEGYEYVKRDDDAREYRRMIDRIVDEGYVRSYREYAREILDVLKSDMEREMNKEIILN